MLSNKQFNTKLAALVRSAKSMRESVQILIESGCEQYLEHGDTGQLTRLVKACVGVKSLPTTVIKDYIKACANVKYTKASDNVTMVFKKNGKEPEVKMLEQTWYEWDGNSQHKPKPDFDLTTVLAQALKRMQKAEDDSEVKFKDKARDEAIAARVGALLEEFSQPATAQ